MITRQSSMNEWMLKEENNHKEKNPREISPASTEHKMIKGLSAEKKQDFVKEKGDLQKGRLLSIMNFAGL
jgi:hypothetical protein